MSIPASKSVIVCCTLARSSRREQELILSGATGQHIRAVGRENDVLAGGALQRDVRAGAGLVEDKIHGVGGTEAVRDGERHLVGRRREWHRD